MNKKENKISKEIKINKKSARRNYSNQTGITLIALVVTIVVLLILAGVSLNAIFSENGIIKRAQDAQNKMDQATQNDLDSINELNNWIDGKTNGTTGGNTTGGNDNLSTTTKISTLLGTVVDKNTKAEDAYGNKITIPKGFKVLAHGTATESASYTYSGDNIPAVQDGIVIEDKDGNQFVWVPVGTIKNKDNTTNTITLGRYSKFTATDGEYTPAQVASVENCTQTVTINDDFQELSTSREGYSAPDPTTGDSTAQNATARNLEEFISTTLAKGGYYIARFEASGTTSKVTLKYNQTVLTNITQPNAAKVARSMYGDTTDYASDLVNSYAWDTAIIFIQTYSTGEDASSYASKNKSTSFANTGKNNDKYCNIWDMSGNAFEWTTEYSTESSGSYFGPCVSRGGYYDVGDGGAYRYSSHRHDGWDTAGSYGHTGIRTILYVK